MVDWEKEMGACGMKVEGMGGWVGRWVGERTGWNGWVEGTMGGWVGRWVRRRTLL